MKTKEREKLFSLVKRSKVSFLKKSFVTAILVISVLALFTAAVAGADDPPCTCGDICVNETGWWRAGGDFNASSTPIQHAIDNATAGNTICVKDGTYTENVDVNKRLTIRSENGSASTIVNAADSTDHVFEVTTDYVNISGFTVKGATYPGCIGIYLNNVDHCNISGNDASDNYFGIVLSSSSSNTITNNYASYNNMGIGLFDYSRSNTITGNNANYNLGMIGTGIGLDKSGNNTLRNNLMSGNMYNFGAEGFSYSELDNDIDTSNLVDGKPIYYLVDASGVVIDLGTNAGTVYCINCNNVTVKDLTLTNNDDGIHFYNTSNSRIENNCIDQCFDGIRLWSSSNNIITGNSVSDVGFGIALWMSSGNTITANNACYSLDYPLIVLDRSDNNTFTNNNVSHGYEGIFIQYSNNNTITNNTASNSYVHDGISLEGSDNNTITDNTASNNLRDGISLEGSSNNTITGNTATSNKEYGICLDFSSNNLIYNNYFNNTNNARDDGNNIWNITKTLGTNIIGGPYLGGNYWSDYAGKDLDGDGLGDTLIPYNSSGNIMAGGDYHPLVPVEVLPVHNLNTGENFSTIQEAIDAVNTTDGQTITVDPGTYNENVEVYKRLTIKSTSGNPDDTIVNANNPDDHVFAVTTDYVNISGFTVKNATICSATVPGYAGIYLDNVDHCNISHNNASDNCYGISLESSSSNTITDNNATYNYEFGIGLSDYSSSNTLTNNNASYNGWGIGLFDYSSSNTLTGNNASYNHGLDSFGIGLSKSGNNTLRNNLMSGNMYNFEAEGWSYSELDNDIDISNLVDGKPIYYLVDASGTVIDLATNAGTVYCINCDNVTVKDMTLAKNGHGICFYNTSSSRIENNHISNCYDGIGLLSSSNNSITGNDVGNGHIGIHLWMSSGNTITDNNAYYGMDYPNIVLEGSDNNIITGNNASSSFGGSGIYLKDSDNNTITDNIANSNIGSGISLEESSNNNLTNNTMSGNLYQNFFIDGYDLSHFIQNIDTSNTVDGRPIYYWVNKQNQQVPDDAGFVGVVNSTNITVSDTKNYDGILFAYTTNSRIENVNASIYSIYGIRLLYSSNNTLSNNTASTFNDYSILLYSSSNNMLTNNTVSNSEYSFLLEDSSDNTLTNNTASNNNWGIYLVNSSNNMLTNNTVSNSVDYGIVLFDSSSNNMLTNNTASNNDCGIYLEKYSSSNILTGNNASNNDNYGIYLCDSCDNNSIYNNYFNNTNNAYDDGNNIWNITKTLGTNIIGGPYLGGNYWSDYAGEDLDGDGLGDTLLPYNSSGNIIVVGDYHPLTMPALTPTP